MNDKGLIEEDKTKSKGSDNTTRNSAAACNTNVHCTTQYKHHNYTTESDTRVTTTCVPVRSQLYQNPRCHTRIQ